MISCALSSDQIKNLYKHVYNAMKTKLGAEKPIDFDANEYMQNLFDEISKRESPETAAKFLQQIPKFINILATTRFANKITSVKGLTDVVIPAIQEFSDENAIPGIITRFTVPTGPSNEDIKDAAIVNKVTKDAVILVDEEEKEESAEIPGNVAMPNRYKSFSVFTGTLQQFKKLKPADKDALTVEKLDEERDAVAKILTLVDDAYAMQDDFTTPFTYQGKVIKVKATNLLEFAKKNSNALDKTTKDEAFFSASQIKKGIAKEGVTQAKDRVLLVLTDVDGNNLYFDKEGNLTSETEGQLVYQILKDIRDTSDGYKVTDIYGKEELIASPETIAKETYEEQLDGKFEDYLKEVTENRKQELKELFGLKNLAITKDVMLDYNGMSNGVAGELSGAEIPLSEILKFPGVEEKNLANIKTLSTARNGRAVGSAYMTLNGSSFLVKRSQITEDIIKQIMDVMFNPNLSYELKKRFYSQFIPEDASIGLSKKIRKHSIMPNDAEKSFKIVLFDKVGLNPMNQVANTKLTNDKLKRAPKEELDKFRAKFENALRTGTSKNDYTYISYPSEKKSQDFLVYNSDTSELEVGDYIEHLKVLNGPVVMSNLDPGFYNKNLLFSIPNEFTNAIKKAQEEAASSVKENPSSAKFAKDALADRLRNGEIITGTITRPPGSITGYTFTEANGNSVNFFNQYKKDSSITQLDMTSEDVISDAMLKLLPFKEADGKVFTDIVEVYNTDNQLVGNVQETDFTPSPKIEQLKNEVDIIEQTESPNTPVAESLFDSINFSVLRRQGYAVDKVTQEELDNVNDFWNNTALGKDMQKHITLGTMFNIANSNVFAEFVVNGAALLNPEIKTLGAININPNKGTFVDMYHEAWHVFTQLYMTKKQKRDLYNEVKNFKNDKGEQPYLNMSSFEIEEMLAEDFRSYMKKAYTKKGMSQRNTIFRKILNFLKSLFGKKTKENTINATTESMAVPSVNELFTKLNLSNKHPELLNDYSASISNVKFWELKRGVRSVSNSRESVLSEQDGKLMVDSADMVISGMIDGLFEHRQKNGETENLRSGTLGMLLDPENRAFTFNYVKAKFEEKLKYFKAQLKKQEGVTYLDDITNFENLENNAVAILKEKNGDNKYVFLSSQVKGFDKLTPDIKKGERIKGDTFHDIKIVGDFYKHKTIELNGKKVGIIVVSRQSDALLQYENYKKGGAEVYEDVIIKKITEVNLPQDQEFILDNVRMLQATLDNFGETDYDLKNESPQGFLAYFNDESDYEIGKTKYYIDVTEEKDENGDEIDEFQQDQEGDSEIIKDKLTGKKSMLELAQKEVIYILKSLHKINKDGSAPLNRLGFKEKADFRKVWNIVTKSIGGVRNRNIAYNKLLAEAKKFPEIEQLMEYKFPDPKAITNSFEQDVSSSFWQTFSRPSAKYVQYTMFPVYEKTMNLLTFQEEDTIVGYDSDVTDSSLAIYSTVKKFEANFKGSLGTKYILKNPDNQSILDIEAIVKDFSNKSDGTLNINKAFDFLNSFGMSMDNTEVIRKDLTNNIDYYGVEFMFNVFSGFNNIENNKTQATEKQLEALSAFKINPVASLTTEIPKGILSNFKGPVLEKTVVNRIAELQLTYGYESANPAMLLPDGNLVYGTLNHSEVSVIIDGINSVENLTDLWIKPEFKYLSGFNPAKNTFTMRSKVFASIFNTGNKKGNFPKRKGKGIEHLHVSGTKIGDNGTNTTDLEPLGKFMQERDTTLLAGVSEFNRMAEKKSSFGARISGGIPKFIANNISKGDDANLWVDVSMFRNTNNAKYTDGELFAVDNYFIDYIAVEFDRIRKFKQDENSLRTIKGFNRPVGKNKKGEILRAGEVFTDFDNILKKTTQIQLYKLIKDPLIDFPTYVKAHPELRKLIVEDITEYFNETLVSLKKNYLTKMPFREKKLLSKLGYTDEQISKNNNLLTLTEVEDALMKAYMYNDWIQKFEMVHLFIGDPAQFDNDKQDFSKRGPGSTSDGDGFLSDIYFQKFVNEVFNKKTYATEMSKKLDKKLDTFEFNGTLNTAIIQDAKRESVYLSEYQESWTEYYTKLLSGKYSGEKLIKAVKDRVARDSEPYEGMTESDGAGMIAFDTYRLLKKAANAWGPKQESLYQDIIAGVEVDPKKIKQFFSVYKLHYYGEIANAPISARAMYKFALNPLLPTVAKKGTALYDLHIKMMKDNIQFVLFGSASKAAALTKDGEFDNLFGDKTMTSVNEDAEFTPNVIYLEYLKDVTKVADKLKNEISFPTQQRMIVLDSLFDGGALRNTKNKTAVDNYDNAVSSYTNILEKELLNKIGYEYVDGKYQGKLDKLVELIREELGAKGVPEVLIKLLDTRTNGSLSMDFSIHPEADIIEKIIVNRIQKTVIKQKTKGESMVQMPSTFYNGIWDSEYQRDEAIKNNDELIKKYLGSNNLPFYRWGKIINEETGERAPTHLMKVAIPFNGDFKNILKVKHNDGEVIGTVDRLNEMIKNDDWLAKHSELITITGPRIPTDKANVIVGAEVWHFLDETMGNTVIVPSEIVAAAGSDFDVDKIFFMFPNIDANGELIKEVENLDETVDKINKAKKKDKKLKGADSVIAQQKKYLQNKLIKDTIALLRLPENFALLTKPNATYLVEDNVEFFADKTQQYNEKLNRHGEPINTNSGKEVMSPSRNNDIERNLSVHDKNLTGSKPLGIFAKKNKTHILYKSIGAKLPSSYKATVWNNKLKKYDEVNIDYDMVLRMRHNKKTDANGKEYISLSNELNVDYEKIGDIYSHGLQGLLDRAKNPFPKTLNIITESTPVLLHLLEAGVGIMDSLAFINTPLAIEYFDNQKILGSSVGVLVEPGIKKNQVKSTSATKVINNVLSRLSTENKDIIKDITKEINRQRLYDVIDMMRRGPKDKVYLYKLSFNAEPEGATAEYILGTNNFPISGISELKEYNPEIKGYDGHKILFSYSNSLISNDNYYYAAQKIWNAAFGEQKDLSSFELKDLVTKQDSSSLKSLAVFLHLIQIEKQSKGMSDLEIMFSPDTGLLDTTLLVKKRDQAYKNFSEMSKIDKETLENLRYKSLLSSFYKSDLILDIVLPLFPLRLNESIQNFISDKLLNNGDIITQKYGPGQKGQERFTNTYNNSVVNYIFQNTMSGFNTTAGEVLDLPESFNGIPVVKTEGQSEPVIIENGEIKVDMEKALADYKAKVFLNTSQGEDSHAKREMDTFSTSENPFKFANDYVRYLTELAYLKKMNPIESLQKNKRFRRFVANNNSEKLGYEKYLSEQALMKAYNYAFVMGTTKYSYTNMVMDTIQEFDSINLKENYPILNQLSPIKNIKEVNALELNDKSDAKGTLAESYYKNLRQLADESVRKVTGNTEAADADNKRISEVFEIFSLMMFYQHGTGYSKFGFNKVLDPAEYVSIMQKASNGFLNNNLKPLVFEEIYNRMIVRSMFKNFITTPIDYADPQPMSEERTKAFLDSLNDIMLGSGTIEKEVGVDDVEPEDVPEGPIEGPTQPSTSVDNTNKPILNSLPNKSSSPTMTYAGIGSRQTPQEVLDKMTEVAKYLDGLGYTLQTGFTFKNKETNLDEEGADKAFSDGSKNKTLFGPYAIRKTVKGIVSADKYNEAVTEKSSAIVKEVHPAPDRLTPGAIKLMARNTNQIFGKNLDNTVDFVIFYAPETNNPLRPKGGTGQAVEMARRKGIPTINMADTNWREQLKNAIANKPPKPTQSSTSVNEFDIADSLTPIEQNFKDGDGGRQMQPQFKGKSTMDLIMSGDRTRTTRAKTDIQRMAKDYNLSKISDLVGKVIRMTDKTGRQVYTRITKVAPFTQEYQDATWQKEGWAKSVTDKNVGNYPYAIEFEVIQPSTQPTGAPVSNTNKPKGVEVKEGIYVNQAALSKEEQLELFDYLKPYLEEQGAKTNKGTQASKMMGLGLRWDYKSNNPGKSIVDTKEIILPASKNKYGYYSTSINNQPLAPISNRFRELMAKATGIDMTNYDGAIINLYSEDNFITSHNDVDESITAINYPVIGVNLGGNGNFSIEPRDGTPIQTLNLESGTAYAFGVDGVNRTVYHRTFPTPQNSFLPKITTKLDGKTYPAGSYRVTITMRRIMPLEPGMPSAPSVITTEPTEDNFDLNITDQITILEGELANLEDMKQELLERSIPVLIATNLPKIKPESARRETGVAVGTSKDINPGLLSNNGVSVERAAELINEGLFYEESGFPEIDMQDIRSYIIDILQTGVKNFVNDYTKQDKIDNLKAEIGSLKQEMQNSKNKNTGIQLDIFNTENAPEGLPPIDRTSENCE